MTANKLKIFWSIILQKNNITYKNWNNIELLLDYAWFQLFLSGILLIIIKKYIYKRGVKK